MPSPGLQPPLFGTGTSPFLKSDPEIRRAERVLEKPSWLVGKRTYIGIGITIASLLGKFLNFDVPADQINGALDVVEANWDGIMETITAIGVVITAIGARAKQMRHKEAVATVNVVANALVDARHEVKEAKAETVAVEKKLEVVSDVLTPAQVVEVKEKMPAPKIQWGEDNTRTAGLVREITNPANTNWRSPTPEETANR